MSPVSDGLQMRWANEKKHTGKRITCDNPEELFLRVKSLRLGATKGDQGTLPTKHLSTLEHKTGYRVTCERHA